MHESFEMFYLLVIHDIFNE